MWKLISTSPERLRPMIIKNSCSSIYIQAEDLYSQSVTAEASVSTICEMLLNCFLPSSTKAVIFCAWTVSKSDNSVEKSGIYGRRGYLHCPVLWPVSIDLLLSFLHEEVTSEHKLDYSRGSNVTTFLRFTQPKLPVTQLTFPNAKIIYSTQF